MHTYFGNIGCAQSLDVLVITRYPTPAPIVVVCGPLSTTIGAGVEYGLIASTSHTCKTELSLSNFGWKRYITLGIKEAIRVLEPLV